MTRTAASVTRDENPLLQPWTTPFEMPPFDQVEVGHYRPAFESALATNVDEIAAIAESTDAPSFDNTIEALERSGHALDRVCSVFFNLTGADTTDALEAIERDMAPVLARHSNAVFQNDSLYRRVEALAEREDELDLNAEQARVLERYRTIFRRNGCGLPPEIKQRLAAISERLATLGTTFSQNVLADEKSYTLVLNGEEDLAGLPEFLRQSAARAAADRGLAGKHLITLARSSIEGFLQFSSRRDLRERAFKAWSARGEAGATDNRPVIAEMVALRAERAQLLGYKSFAHFRLEDTMAKKPEAALDLLHSVWKPAQARAAREQAALEKLAQGEGHNEAFAPWDWRHYSEKQRSLEFDLDESAIKPYLQLDNMIAAAFDTASRLFGLSFTERHDLPLYHPDVRAWEVNGADGSNVGLFLGDYFARSSKRSGAWMSAFRSQEKLAGNIRPIIVNVMNFSKAEDGAPALLSFDDARTLFHEFGHALHGLLSNVTYPLISGTGVSRDFVEFPSQLYEHWIEQAQVLQRFARHHITGEPMPKEFLDRLLASRTFNQGFSTVEYVASALVDLKVHLLDDATDFDISAFEKATLAEIGMPEAITMRHRPTHFTHVFSGDGYSSAYYSYLWSEVLDADGFGAFEEAGDLYDPETAKRLHDFVYAAGNSRDPAEAYRGFRGRDPIPAPLLVKRGLSEPQTAES
jgi:peptidyl-dipeptidase Dcp